MEFMDLHIKEDELKREIEEVFLQTLESARYVGGPFVEGFEREFARWIGVRRAVSVGSGTQALKYCLWALGIGDGDEVITTPLTFVATAEVIVNLGARPVFVDVNPKTFQIDEEKIEEAITPRTKAILPVHLFGAPAEMNRIMEVASRHRLWVVEDAAQAHGAIYKGKKVGSIGHCGAFSFYPTKNLSAMGEAGAITTDSDEIAEKVILIKNHGQDRPYHSLFPGENGRMDALQAGILLKKLRYIDRWNRRRQEIAEIYRRELSPLVQLQEVGEGCTSVYHLFVVLHPARDELQRRLSSLGIPTRIYYPIPLHLQKAFSHLGYGRGDFPVAEKISKELLALPMGPWMGEDEVYRVVEGFKRALG